MYDVLKNYNFLFLYPESMPNIIPWGLGFFGDPGESCIIAVSKNSPRGYESADTVVIQDSLYRLDSEGKSLLKVLQ